MSLGKELYDAVEHGDEGVVKRLLTDATAKDVNWIGKVSYVAFKDCPVL